MLVEFCQNMINKDFKNIELIHEINKNAVKDEKLLSDLLNSEFRDLAEQIQDTIILNKIRMKCGDSQSIRET